jgi:hypothetical protein
VAGPINTAIGGDFGGFDLTGVAPIGYALFAFALGTAVGALVRRPIPAMAIPLVGYQAAHYAIATRARPHYATPLIDAWDPLQGSSRDGLGDWSYGGYALDAIGKPLPQDQLNDVYHQFSLAGNKEGINAYLHDLGLRYADYYQPAARFWAFQTIEATIYLVLTAALLGFTLWWTRRYPR